MWSKIYIALGVIVTIAAIVGGVFAVEGHYAKEAPTNIAFEEVRSDIVMVNSRIDAMKLEDKLLLVTKRIEALEDRWGEKFKEEYDRHHSSIEELLAFMPKEYREEYREKVAEKIELEKQIEEKNKVKKKES